MPLAKNFKISDYINKTKDWNGADIEAVCRKAGTSAIKSSLFIKEKIDLIITKTRF